MKLLTKGWLAAAIPMLFLAVPASAQDSAVYTQCPETTDLHPDAPDEDNIPAGDFPGPGDVDYNGNGILETAAENLQGIDCMHLSGGDGMVTMADDEPIYIFSFAEIPLPGEAYPGGTAPTIESGEYPGFAMEYGILAAEAPAPTIEVDEDDELFLTLTNVGMAIRPDLFDPHTVHWHGFPEASSVFDGVPDASIAINMGASLTYYYNVRDAGTYMFHCHVEATEHMQMGMLGNLYVHPRQNKLAAGTDLSDAFASNPANVALGGRTVAPATDNGAVHQSGATYAYNDGDGTTRYDAAFPIQIGSFDKAFHDASFTVQPLPFADMRDTYFMLNGRGYPDTVAAEDAILTGGENRQPVSSLIEAASGDLILLRISNLNVTQFNTIGTNGPPMEVVALDARLLRADDGTNMYYKTNSLTLGGGQSADVIIDTTGIPSDTTFFLYSTNLEMLANHHDNFGGMMTEIRIN
ncbi:MAG: multicopper oxidase domain-containing protein [Woeseiaceae bacterium]